MLAVLDCFLYYISSLENNNQVNTVIKTKKNCRLENGEFLYFGLQNVIINSRNENLTHFIKYSYSPIEVTFQCFEKCEIYDAQLFSITFQEYIWSKKQYVTVIVSSCVGVILFINLVIVIVWIVLWKQKKRSYNVKMQQEQIFENQNQGIL